MGRAHFGVKFIHFTTRYCLMKLLFWTFKIRRLLELLVVPPTNRTNMFTEAPLESDDGANKEQDTTNAGVADEEDEEDDEEDDDDDDDDDCEQKKYIVLLLIMLYCNSFFIFVLRLI